MTKYREILNLTVLELSQRSIIRSINVFQKTIVKVHWHGAGLLRL